jgi:hypothetical protein
VINLLLKISEALALSSVNVMVLVLSVNEVLMRKVRDLE